MSFGPNFPPKEPIYRKVLDAGTLAVASTVQVLGTFILPEGSYLVNVKGAMSGAVGLNNHNIHLIVSQALTPDPSRFESFAFQSFPAWTNNSIINAVSVTDTLVVIGDTPISLYVYDSSNAGSPSFTVDWSDVFVTRIRKVD